MRLINPFLLVVLFVSSSAWAGQSDAFLFQVKASEAPRAATQPSFWDLLSGRARLEADLTVKVTDAVTGQPISGAAVMVGEAIGNPFPENVIRSADDGTATFTHESLRSGTHFPITVGKAGYTVMTLVGRTENVVEVALQKIPGERDYGFLQGRLTGFPPGFDGGTLELGLFIPATRPEGLLNFDLGLFVTPYKVKIDIYGERDIPGNVVLPEQSKHWGFIPISLNKPDFIMPLPKGLEAHMAGMTGSVPISPAVDAIRAKDYVSVLNMASFNHVGWTRRMTVKGDEKFDLNARYEVVPQQLGTKVSGVPDKTDVVSIALVDPEGDGGDFVAMDLKANNSEDIKNGNTSFKLGMIKARPQGANYYIFTGLFDRKKVSQAPLNTAATPDFRWLVGSMKPVGSSRARPAADTRFNTFLKPMKVQGVGGGNREYHFTSPASSTVTPDFTMINIVSEKQNKTVQGNVRTILWSTTIPGAVSDIKLPDLGRPVLPNPDTSRGERFFWEVVAVKTRARAKSDFDLQAALRNVEHVSSFTKAF